MVLRGGMKHPNPRAVHWAGLLERLTWAEKGSGTQLNH